jgi:hypothetical protein
LAALALLALPSAAAAKPRPMYWGAWIGSQLTGGEAPWDMEAAERFEAELGRGLSLLHFSSPFAECDDSGCSYYSFPAEEMDRIREHGAIPLFSWNSGTIGENPRDIRLVDLSSGRYDFHIRAFALAARDWGHPFFLRFNWEMNGNWFPWGVGVNGNRPGDFKAAWRRVHDIFHQVGADNATWVWCPYARDEPLRPFYPGGRYVDWTCLDGYNWGPESPEPAPWRSFREIFSAAYSRVAGQIARRMFAALRRGFPKVRGLVWFNKVDREVDWPLETSDAASQAFSRGLLRGYKQNVFSGLQRSPIPPPRR